MNPTPAGAENTATPEVLPLPNGPEAQAAEPTTIESVVVPGPQSSPYVARTISRPLYPEPLCDTAPSVTVVPQ